jgi:hypothetical protein
MSAKNFDLHTKPALKKLCVRLKFLLRTLSIGKRLKAKIFQNFSNF